MALPRTTQIFEPWAFQGVAEDPAVGIRQLNDRLRELSAKYSSLVQALSFGPVLGAYVALPFFIRDWNDASTAVAAGEVSPTVFLPEECVPVAFTASTIDDSATVQLRDGASELLTADLDTAASPPMVRGSANFTARRFEAGARLFMRVETITGAPLAVYGVLWVNQIPKVQR